METDDTVKRVRDINWANTNIYRAGIVPICIENGYKWIGLGISKFSGNITSIGGSYENVDHDLLSTAVREYNEEVGNNMKALTEEGVYNYYAISSEYCVSILLPIKRRPNNFKETEELFDIIWITPTQLRIMAANQEYPLFHKNTATEKYIVKKGKYGSRTRAFIFSTDLKFMWEKIANAVEDEKCFMTLPFLERFIRPKRMEITIIPRIKTNVEEFLYDCIHYKAWGNTALILTPNIIGLMRRDNTTYLLPHYEIKTIIEGLKESNTTSYVAFSSDLSNPMISELISDIKLVSVESGTKRLNIPSNNFLKEIYQLRDQHDKNMTMNGIIKELNLIIHYEVIIYETIQQQGKFFNEKRGYFLKGVNNVNRILEKYPNGLYYRKLKSLLNQFYTCRNPPSHIVISIMIETGLLQQNNMTTNIHICV